MRGNMSDDEYRDEREDEMTDPFPMRPFVTL